MPQKTYQDRVNEEHDESIKYLGQHAEVSNREVGELKIIQAEISKDVAYLKEWAKSLDAKMWAVMLGIGGLILKILYDIFVNIKR